MARYARDFLMARAAGRCEYCHFPATCLSLSLHVDHIIAQQHMDYDSEDNLAVACAHCNASKGPNLASIDPQTKAIVRLFNPRTDLWADHFTLANDEIVGLTDIGRITARLLDMNNPNNVLLRKLLRLSGTLVRA